MQDQVPRRYRSIKRKEEEKKKENDINVLPRGLVFDVASSVGELC